MLRIYTPHNALRQTMEQRQQWAHLGDCGVDLFVHSFTLPDMPMPPQITIKTGVHVAAYDYHGRPTGCLLYPRSSISNTPFTLANSVGVIDAGYRGEVMAKLNRVEGSLHTVNLGDSSLRLVQLCLPSLRPPRVVFVDSLEDLGNPLDSRGSGGFGSTNTAPATGM